MRAELEQKFSAAYPTLLTRVRDCYEGGASTQETRKQVEEMVSDLLWDTLTPEEWQEAFCDAVAESALSQMAKDQFKQVTEARTKDLIEQLRAQLEAVTIKA